MGRFWTAVLLAGATVISFAQVPSSPDELKSRGNTAPGTARDGSAPADGAIIGGSLEPDIRKSPAPRRDVARCRELHGKLREECMKDLHPESPRPSRAETESKK